MNHARPTGMSTEHTGCSTGTRLSVPKTQVMYPDPHTDSERSGRARFAGVIKPHGAASTVCKYTGCLVLATYTLFLFYRALRHSQAGHAQSVPLWQLQDSRQLLAWMGGLVFGAFGQFAYFVPLGFVTAIVVPRGLGRLCRLVTSLLAFSVAVALAILVQSVQIGRSWHLAATTGLALPVLGSLFGAWMGTTWLRGRRARLLLLPKITLLILLFILCSSIILWLTLEETPLPFEAARVTSTEKRRLVYLIRSKSPRSLKEGQIHTLRLTNHDINLLLSWGLSLGSLNRKAKVSLAYDHASLSASIGVPLGGGKTRYLNLEADGNSEIEDGIVSLNIYRCQLGSVKVPRWFLTLLSSTVSSLLNHNRFSRPFVDAIKAVSIKPDLVEVTYSRVDLPANFREDLLGRSSGSEDVLTSTRAQVDNLLAIVAQTANKPPSIGMCFETVFSFARERSVDKDPVTENRAGIFALGVLLGHRRVEEFLGPVFPDRDCVVARRALRRVTVHGRPDWTKHFCVSAAIAILSDEVSDAAGLLKEVLDADRGGSGFSFADLLADRAGTTFAVQATRSETAARAMQERIASGFRMDDFFPDAADLPEGISDAELQSHFGGVGGPMYNRLVEEIERRIADCAAYR